MAQKGSKQKETISLEKFAKYVAGRVMKFMDVMLMLLSVRLRETDVKDIPTRMRSSKLITMVKTPSRINAGSLRITTLLPSMSY